MTGEYAIRAMVGLTRIPYGTVAHIPDLSKEWDIPVSFLRKIITLLAKAGLVYSQRGNNGGIRLAIPAEKLTLLDVIEAVEGKIFLNKCLMGHQFCERSVYCSVHLVWCEAQEAVKTILSRQSLAEIAKTNSIRKAQFETNPIPIVNQSPTQLRNAS